jgi:uncharacterized protein YjeT (DUF2065 family)
MGNDLWVAIALVLVIEGVIPFLSPQGLKRALLTILQTDDRTVRMTGLVSMVAGVLLLYLVH